VLPSEEKKRAPNKIACSEGRKKGERGGERDSKEKVGAKLRWEAPTLRHFLFPLLNSWVKEGGRGG